MKKLLILLILVLGITGCTTKETSVTDADGEAKTYKFFEKSNYNPDQYTLKLKNNDSKITIINTANKNYYNTDSKGGKTTIIEKDGQKYTSRELSESYTVEPIATLDNYGLGYLPVDMKELKKASYKIGKEKIGWTTYNYETYQYDGGTTTYYFKGEKLKKIKNKTPLNENMVTFVSLTNKVDTNKFELPKKYQEITY